MAHASDPRFVVHHALKIKGFVKVDGLSELTGFEPDHVQVHLDALVTDGHAMFREARGLWQLTPDGRAAHEALLEADASRDGFRDGLQKHYPTFLELNEELKQLCNDWQLKDGETNDHSDAAYDQAILERLSHLNERSQPVVGGFGAVAVRFSGYAPRLVHTVKAVHAGETKMFTGVMCGSFHDVWMELHEDLLLTQKIDRAEEGSF
jgi:hypothetical protein